jgi:two-component system sensor histidine kinase/response regulator
MTTMKILVVDDNEMNRLLATQVLRDRGWAVDEASGGLEAMMKLEQARFDAVLLDVGMPYLGGDELCQWIRADDRMRAMPVIAYTAHVMPNEIRRFLDMGFNHVIPKPASCDSLVREIENHIGHA